jgi:hypothetical protein
MNARAETPRTMLVHDKTTHTAETVGSKSFGRAGGGGGNRVIVATLAHDSDCPEVDVMGSDGTCN